MKLKSEMERTLREVKQENVTDLAGVGEILAAFKWVLSVSQALTLVFLCSGYTSFTVSSMIISDEGNSKSHMPWKQGKEIVS